MNAVHTLKLGADGPTDTVCFHAQQCIEKYLKALLVLRRAVRQFVGAATLDTNARSIPMARTFEHGQTILAGKPWQSAAVYATPEMSG